MSLAGLTRRVTALLGAPLGGPLFARSRTMIREVWDGLSDDDRSLEQWVVFVAATDGYALASIVTFPHARSEAEALRLARARASERLMVFREAERRNGVVTAVYRLPLG